MSLVLQGIAWDIGLVIKGHRIVFSKIEVNVIIIEWLIQIINIQDTQERGL